MCSGRVDLSFVLRAFLGGADGVFIGGCWPGECHYVTEGNYDALGNTLLCKKLIEQININPKRLRLEWLSSSEGTRFAEVVDDFVAKLKELGPLREKKGINQIGLKFKLEAIIKLIPFIKLVQAEKFKIPVRREEEYNKFYLSDEFNELFNDIIVDKLTISQIVSLIKKRPLSNREISEILGLNPSQVSNYMKNSSRQGLIKYDINCKCYTSAGA